MFIADIPPQQVPVITQAVTTEQTVGRNSQRALRRMESDETIRRNALRLLRPTRANVPPQYLPVMIAQATPVQQGAKKLDASIGVCQLIPVGPIDMPQSAEYQLGAVGTVATYLDRVEHTKVYQYLNSVHILVNVNSDSART